MRHTLSKSANMTNTSEIVTDRERQLQHVDSSFSHIRLLWVFDL